MIKTVCQSWDEFQDSHRALMAELLPLLRCMDEDSIALRTLRWAVLPRWEKNAFFFESYEDEPEVYADGGEDVQLLVTDVPWDEWATEKSGR